MVVAVITLCDYESQNTVFYNLCFVKIVRTYLSLLANRIKTSYKSTLYSNPEVGSL